MDMGIQGKTALITGGGTGIGKAAALALANEGVTVIITSRQEAHIESALADLHAISPGHKGIVSDIVLDHEPTRIVQQVCHEFGGIDIVVNNVGDTLNILDPYCSLDDWNRLFRLIMGVAIETNNAAIPIMKKSNWGRIVNITAGASMENSGPVPYCSFKAAFTAYSRSMARILALENSGIVMSALLPGVILTEEGHWAKVLQERPEHAEKYLDERTVLKRFGYPEEVSPIITLLCSNHASFCIGSVIPVEGGQAKHYFQRVQD